VGQAILSPAISDSIHVPVEKTAATLDSGTNTGFCGVAKIAAEQPRAPFGLMNAYHMAMRNSLTPQNEQKTILLVSNDAVALEFMTRFLVGSSYNVLPAEDGEAALTEMKTYGREIHLLLSTLDMPGVNGLGLAAQVSMKWPNLKVLLMSECRAGTLILNEGWHFLPKPFVASQLKALILTLIAPEGMVPKYKRPGFPASKKATA